MDLILENVPKALADRLMNKKYAEVAFRDAKKRFEQIPKIAIKAAKNNEAKLNNLAVMGKLQIALQVANIATTVACTVIICNKLNKIDQKLNDIQKDIADIKDIDFELQIAHPCRTLIGDYKMITDRLRKGQIVSETEWVTLIRGCQNYIMSLYNLRDKMPLDPILTLIFILLPILTNSIMLYYRHYYDVNQGKHILHDEWTTVYDLLLSEEFENEVQDFLFIEKRMTNKPVMEYLAYQRKIVEDNKQQINQLVEDLDTCEGIEGYNEAMLLSRQYAEQQAKSYETELEKEYGPEKTEEIMNQAMQAINAW